MANGKQDRIPGIENKLQDLHDAALSYADKRDERQACTEVMFREWVKNPIGTFIGPSWDKTRIEQYREPIPEFVLNKAIQIKKAMPEVRIYVQHLSEHPDPFLIVATKHKDYECLDAQELWVEVWEEPKFEGRIR
jgi:hypothetical protein